VTLARALEGRSCLTWVRLLLALAVLLSHSWPLSGAGRDPALAGVSLGTYAVYGFFALSGYVVTGSRVRHDLPGFLLRRQARIFPALWTSLTVVAVAFAPLAAATGRGAYSAIDVVGFVVRNFSTAVGQPNIGTLLSSAPVPWAWNGALWTISLEMSCYLVVALVFCAPTGRRVPLRRAAVWNVMAAAAVVFVGWDHPVDRSSWPQQLVRLMAFFAAGSLLWAARHQIRVTPLTLAASGAVVVAAALVGATPLLAPLPLAYTLLGAAQYLPDLEGDISYGVYLYGFPVQQVLHQALPSAHRWLFAFLAVVPTVTLAWLSWRTVERPALRWAASLRAQGSPSAVPAPGLPSPP
jgi:peptidoglycan/LPS O-acetylase OafA/YrhL